jgi:hypothetical protein
LLPIQEDIDRREDDNGVMSVIDETDRLVAERRVPNDLVKTLAFVAPWRDELAGVVVESMYYWC